MDVIAAFVDQAIKGPPAEPWGEPLPLPTGLPPVAPFTDTLLPEALRAWVVDIAERMQCPPDYPAVAAIVSMGAVIGRQLGIRPKRRDDWLVVPNLWGAIVGRPSLMKTPALAESRKMLARLEIKAKEKHEAALADHKTSATVADMIGKEKKRAAAKAIEKAMTEGDNPADAARAVLAGAVMEAPEPVRRRYTTQDPTVEKLGELLCETPRGLLIFRDELTGWLKTMDKDGHENDRSFYLEAWNGTGRYTYDRIGRGTVEIDAACVSLLGGIQPGPLRAYIAAATNGGAGDDGLLQRLQLLVWPDAGGEWVNIDRWPDSEAKNRVYAIFERLDQLCPHIDKGDVPALQFDDAGQDAFNTWREKFERRIRAENMPPALEAHVTKYRSLLPSLALIFHLIDSPDHAAVGAEHVHRAEAWLTYLETHARRLYAQVLNPGMAAAVALSERLKNLPEPFTAREVSQRGWAGLDREAVEKALLVMVDMRHLAARTVSTGGRPTKTYSKNPALKFPISQDREPSKGSKPPFEAFEGRSYGDIGKKPGDDLGADEVEI